jgi:hypothetical protein
MVVVIPEVLLSQLLYKIATPFQRLTSIFGVRELSGTIADTALCNRKSVMQDEVQHWMFLVLDMIAATFQRLHSFSGSSNPVGLL